jgi:hypothetical protein
MNIRTLNSYEHLQETDSKIDPMCIEIDEVITDVSLSTKTSSPTKKYFIFLTRHQSVKSKILNSTNKDGAKLCSRRQLQIGSGKISLEHD